MRHLTVGVERLSRQHPSLAIRVLREFAKLLEES